tara:strand:- start:4018 stop:4368 length:351 start_codon:yes stop_codon:yes gene_type:complete
MSNIIRIKIDLNKIDQSKCFRAQSGAVYLDAALIETAPTNHGDWRDKQTHMIVQDIPQAERLAGKKGAIVGNGEALEARSETQHYTPPAYVEPNQADPPSNQGSANPAMDDQDIPF